MKKNILENKKHDDGSEKDEENFLHSASGQM